MWKKIKYVIICMSVKKLAQLNQIFILLWEKAALSKVFLVMLSFCDSWCMWEYFDSPHFLCLTVFVILGACKKILTCHTFSVYLFLWFLVQVRILWLSLYSQSDFIWILVLVRFFWKLLFLLFVIFFLASLSFRSFLLGFSLHFLARVTIPPKWVVLSHKQS